MTMTQGSAQDDELSRVLVLGTDIRACHAAVAALSERSGQKCAPLRADAPDESVHHVTLRTKYYTADVACHLHRLASNELQAPLGRDIEDFEALVWVVDAPSSASFEGARGFLEASLEELSFDVSLVVGLHADAATPSTLTALSAWSQDNAFEFIPVEDASDQPSNQRETIGMDRLLEALHCNMWRSMKTLERSDDAGSASKSTNAVPLPSTSNQESEGANEEDDHDAGAPSRILLLGADLAAAHHILAGLSDLANVNANTPVASSQETHHEMVYPMTLSTKYYNARVEVDLHRIEDNSLVSPLQHDAEAYEALLWVVDVHRLGDFAATRTFVERSIEELTFDVSLVIGVTRGPSSSSSASITEMETWCHENGFEFVPVSTSTDNQEEASDDPTEKRGIARVLEALQCHMWRSMEPVVSVPATKSLSAPSSQVPAPASVSAAPETPSSSATSSTIDGPCATTGAPPDAPPIAITDADAPRGPNADLLSMMFTGADHGDDDGDFAAMSQLFDQVRRIRENGHALSDQERRQQAERVALQLWSMLGDDSDDGDDGGDSS